jgi:hypothetical protein
MSKKEEEKNQPNPYITALVETLLIVILTTLPSIFGFFGMIINSDSIVFKDLYKSGEFFLYAVSFLGSSFLVYNNFKLKQNWKLNLFSLIVLICVFLFSIMYTVAANSVNPKYDMIKYLSIISLLIAIPFFYSSQVINNKPSSPNVGEQRQEEQKVIQDGLI